MTSPIAWVRVIEPNQADQRLRSVYAAVGRGDGSVHNLYKALSLRPEPIVPSDQHYKAVLRSADNTLPGWFLELLSTMVARLARCAYAATNHGQNFRDLLSDQVRAAAILAAVDAGRPEDALEPTLAALVRFGRKLALEPEAMSERDVANVRAAGADDGQIIEAVQAVACFAYWVRVINGLGINPGDEPIGLAGRCQGG